jgi:hypothetical protein
VRATARFLAMRVAESMWIACVQASVNPKAETVEELQGRRKALHLGMCKLAQEDLTLVLQAAYDATVVLFSPPHHIGIVQGCSSHQSAIHLSRQLFCPLPVDSPCTSSASITFERHTSPLLRSRLLTAEPWVRTYAEEDAHSMVGRAS